MDNSQNQLSKDSILLSMKGISEQEYQQKFSTHLSLKESQLNLQSNRQMKQSEISRNQLEIQRICLEETEAKRESLFRLYYSEE